jgi:Rrf2 family protein
MFEITRRADYALRIMLSLGDEAPGTWLSSSTIARGMGVPRPFLHKITAGLVLAGLVRTRAGPRGGLSLARPAESISIHQILEAADGSICLNRCLVRPGQCPRDRRCPAHAFLGKLQSAIVQSLSTVSLADLVADGERRTGRRAAVENAVEIPIVPTVPS